MSSEYFAAQAADVFMAAGGHPASGLELSGPVGQDRGL